MGMEVEKAEGGDKAKFLVFKLGSEIFGTPLLSVREVVEFKEAKPIPNAAEGFEGVINLRGEIIGVMDLRKLLKISGEKPRCLLIFESDRGVLGAVVDRVISVTELLAKDIDSKTAVPNKSFGEYFLGIGKTPQNLITLIDLVKVPQLLG